MGLKIYLGKALNSVLKRYDYEITRSSSLQKLQKYIEQPSYQIERYLRTASIRKLQIGCGPNPLDGWLNTDLVPSKGVVQLDARERLPFPDCSFQYIFCEHFIEHLEYRDGVNLLRECFQILKPKGKIRIATPDLRVLISWYNSEKTELQTRYISDVAGRFFPNTLTHQDVFVMNIWFREFGHKFIYDFEVLRDAMMEVGFRNISSHNVGESNDINLQNLERHGEHVPMGFNELETFVIEGVKP